MGVLGQKIINKQTIDDYEYSKLYKQIANRAIELSEKARCEGLLNLEDLIDEKKFRERDVFECGLRFVIDGTDWELIDKILTNIVNQEKDESKRILKTIQRDAILFIQTGFNTNLMEHVINSLKDLTLKEDPVFKYRYY